MSQRPEMEAVALVTIISGIQRARRTGLLIVKRAAGSVLEEGTITFVKGQVTGSEIGRRRGQDAFNAMSEWKDCRFSFVSPNPQDDMLLFSPSSPHASSTSPSPSTSPLPPVVTTSPLSPVPFSPAPREFSPGRRDYLQPIPDSALLSQSIAFEVALPKIDQMGSRMYRQIFLLIDGRRTVQELLRLTGRTYDEMNKILRKLEQAGVIRIAIPQE